MFSTIVHIVVKQLWQYIKGNNLQNPDNKREIICDPKLKAVFNTDKIDMFRMNKVLGEYVFRPPFAKQEFNVGCCPQAFARTGRVARLCCASLSDIIFSTVLRLHISIPYILQRSFSCGILRRTCTFHAHAFPTIQFFSSPIRTCNVSIALSTILTCKPVVRADLYINRSRVASKQHASIWVTGPVLTGITVPLRFHLSHERG